MARSPQLEELARRVASLERSRLLAKQATLGFSSLDGGAIQVSDDDDNLTMIVGSQFDGTNAPAVVTGPPPPAPSQPMLTAVPGGLRIYWDGTFDGGEVAPMDYSKVTIHAVPTASYVGPDPLDQTNIVGILPTATGGEVLASLPYESHTVYLVSWSIAGKYSAASLVDVAAPTKVEAPDLADLAVLNQHIADGSIDTPKVAALAIEADKIASNAVVAGKVAADAITGREIVAQSITADHLAVDALTAGVVFSGEIQIGEAYWNSVDGLVIPQPGGGIIQFPVDGVSAATITAHLRARSLEVEDNANFYGTSRLYGYFSLGNGIVNPAQPATATTATLDALASALATTEIIGPDGWSSLCQNPNQANQWVTVGYFLATTTLRSFDKTTGAINGLVAPSYADFQGESVTSLGTNYYILGRNTNNGNWQVKVVAATGLAVSATWTLPFAVDDDPAPTIGSDGTNLVIAYTSSGSIRIRRYAPVTPSNPATWTQTGSTVTTTTSVSTSLRAVRWESADFGATRIVVATRTNIRVFNTSGTRQFSDEWDIAGNALRGLIYESGVYRSLDESGNVWAHTPNTRDRSITITYAWADRNATGGTHNTKVGASKNYLWPARKRLKVTFPNPPELTSSSTDAANAIDVFIGDQGGTLWLQSNLAVGTTIATYDTLLSSGTSSTTSPYSTNSFVGLSSASPGVILSDAQNPSDSKPHTKFDGSGFSRIVKLTQAGRVVSGTFAGTGSANEIVTPVVYEVPFAATPSVVITPNQDPTSRICWVANESETGFDLHQYRVTGTASFAVNWIAEAMTVNL